MIVPMKKVTLVVMDRERETALERLREVGVVHLAKKQVSSPVLEKLMEERSRLLLADALLRTAAADAAKKGTVAAETPSADPAGEALRIQEEIKSLQDANAADLREISRLEAWGDVAEESLKELRDTGVDLVAYELSLRDYQRIGDEAKLLLVSRNKTTVRVLSVGAPITDSAVLPGLQAFVFSSRTVSAISEDISDRTELLDQKQEALRSLSFERKRVENLLAEIDAQIEFETARSGMETLEDVPSGTGIAWLRGFVPDSEAGHVKRAALEESWALIIDDVTEDDRVPTKLKNGLFGRLANPIFSFLGTVPGYREFDISVSFLFFFIIFFAMIFGDAGYGSLMLFGSLLFTVRYLLTKKRFHENFLLLYLLSGATIIWGAINGNWFGIAPELLPSGLKILMIAPFSKPAGMDPVAAEQFVQQNVMHLCFIIGIIQFTLAHLKNVKRLFPSPVFMSQLGWLSMVIGLYYIVLNLVIGADKHPIPVFAFWMIGAGLGVYFVFCEQKGGNFFANIGKGFANFLPTFLNAVGSFSDIISYIRLFAVGLAGLSISQAFNDMALGMPGIILQIVAGSLILVLGHGLNMIMNVLSVLVHGVRLNILEYSVNHIGMEWSGFAYKPFASRSVETVEEEQG